MLTVYQLKIRAEFLFILHLQKLWSTGYVTLP